MNLLQTRQVLSYLAATHPNFPKYSPEDRTRVALSYFRLLWRYNVHDVMDAVDRTCRKTRPFVPTLYDIEAEITPSYDVEGFLSDEYYEYEEKLENLRASSDDYNSYQEWHNAITKCKTEMLLLREVAFHHAEAAYVTRELELSKADRQIVDMQEKETKDAIIHMLDDSSCSTI